LNLLTLKGKPKHTSHGYSQSRHMYDFFCQFPFRGAGLPPLSTKPVLPIWKQFEGLTHCHGGRFKGKTSTSHMLYVMLKSPHGLKTSLATASLKFLVSFANCGNLLLKCIHAFPFTGWLIWTSTGTCLILCHWISSPILLETNIFSSTMGSTGNASKPSENHICSHSYLLIWIHCILDRHLFWHNSS